MLSKPNAANVLAPLRRRSCNRQLAISTALRPNFAAASARAVAIAAPTDSHWTKLCAAIDRPDLAQDERTRDNLRRVAHRDFVTDVITAWTRSRTKHEILALLGGRVPVGPVNDARDLFADPHVAARGMLAEVELPGKNARLAIAGTPIKFTATPAGVYRRPPLLGEHTAEILAEIDNASRNRRDDP